MDLNISFFVNFKINFFLFEYDKFTMQEIMTLKGDERKFMN